VFGWQSGREPVEYARAEGHPELLFMKDREINLEEEARADVAALKPGDSSANTPPDRSVRRCRVLRSRRT
jgi:hypothetical protein